MFTLSNIEKEREILMILLIEEKILLKSDLEIVDLKQGQIR